MIDKCSCGATCAQVEALQAEIDRLKLVALRIEQNSTGQLRIANSDGSSFDMSKFIGREFSLLEQGE
jgi:hypothetical protein